MAAKLLSFLIADAVILILMHTLDPIKPRLILKDESGHLVPYLQCHELVGNFSTILITYIGGILVYCCYVSYSIRHVSSDFSEAKWIFFASYNGAMCGIVGIGVDIGLGDSVSPATAFSVMCIATTLGSVTTLVLLLGPKFIKIRAGAQVSNLSTPTSRLQAGKARQRLVLGETEGTVLSGYNEIVSDAFELIGIITALGEEKRIPARIAEKYSGVQGTNQYNNDNTTSLSGIKE